MPELATLLRLHRMASPYKRLGDLVFPQADGRGRDHRSTARIIERVTKDAGLEGVTFHTLRHSFASSLIVRLKLDVETVSRQLVHVAAAITLSVYSHEFNRARNADALRRGLSDGFGHLLASSS